MSHLGSWTCSRRWTAGAWWPGAAGRAPPGTAGGGCRAAAGRAGGAAGKAAADRAGAGGRAVAVAGRRRRQQRPKARVHSRRRSWLRRVFLAAEEAMPFSKLFSGLEIRDLVTLSFFEA